MKEDLLMNEFLLQVQLFVLARIRQRGRRERRREGEEEEEDRKREEEEEDGVKGEEQLNYAHSYRRRRGGTSSGIDSAFFCEV